MSKKKKLEQETKSKIELVDNQQTTNKLNTIKNK